MIMEKRKQSPSSHFLFTSLMRYSIILNLNRIVNHDYS
jgi:hypothetical protein